MLESVSGDCIIIGDPRKSLTKDGYKRITRYNKRWYAHRWFFSETFGPIPSGIHIHHSCRNRLCVNIAHLAAILETDHLKQHHSHKKFCAYGHKLEERNLYIHRKGKHTNILRRRCKKCARDKAHNRYHGKNSALC